MTISDTFGLSAATSQEEAFRRVARLAMTAARTRGARGLDLDALRAIQELSEELCLPDADPEVVLPRAEILGIRLDELTGLPGVVSP